MNVNGSQHIHPAFQSNDAQTHDHWIKKFSVDRHKVCFSAYTVFIHRTAIYFMPKYPSVRTYKSNAQPDSVCHSAVKCYFVHFTLRYCVLCLFEIPTVSVEISSVNFSSKSVFFWFSLCFLLLRIPIRFANEIISYFYFCSLSFLLKWCEYSSHS